MQSLGFPSGFFAITNEKPSSKRGLLLFGLFLAAAYLLPFHLNPFRAFFNDWLAIFGLVVLVMYFFQNGEVDIRLPWISAVPIILGLTILLQVILNLLSEPWDAFIPILYVCLAATAIIFGASIAAIENGSYKLCMVLAAAHLVAGLASVVIATFQFAGSEIIFTPLMMLMNYAPGVAVRPYANLGQSNHLALLFCISIASVWWLYQKGYFRPTVAILTVFFLLWGLTLTQSRIGWIILPAFALILYLWDDKVSPNKVSWKLLSILLLSYTVMTLALPKIAVMFNISVPSLAARVFGGGQSAFHSARLELFRQAWEISLAHPWLGSGWFQFGTQQIIDQNLGSSIYSHHSHNILLNFAAEIGWPITLIICGLFLMWLRRSCLSYSVSVETAFAILFFVAVIVHSLVEYPLWYAIVLVPFALLIGMVHQERWGAAKISLPRFAAFALVLLMSGNLLWIGMDYRRVVAGFNAIEFQTAGIKFDTKAMQKPSFTVFPYMYDYFRFFNININNNMTKEDIAFMERVSKRFGGALVLTRMSQVYAMNGREDDAVKSMTTIKRLHRDLRYAQAYEEWRRAPSQYAGIFKRMPLPETQAKTPN